MSPAVDRSDTKQGVATRILTAYDYDERAYAEPGCSSIIARELSSGHRQAGKAVRECFAVRRSVQQSDDAKSKDSRGRWRGGGEARRENSVNKSRFQSPGRSRKCSSSLGRAGLRRYPERLCSSIVSGLPGQCL